MGKFKFEFKFQFPKKKKKEKIAKPPKPKKVKKPPEPKDQLENQEWYCFLFLRQKDRSEYKARNLKRAQEAIPLLIDGCGGIKNIKTAKSNYAAVRIEFKNKYQLKEDVLKQAGGLSLSIGDRHLIDIFDYIEAKEIANTIRKQAIAYRKKLRVIDWDK